jgi:hypothetical protein
MIRKAVVGRQCSNGTDCVAYPALGQPSKLSWGNPGTTCFACQERRVASELKAAAKGKTSNRTREAELPLLQGHERQAPNTCARRSCIRPATEWDGMTYLCGEHATAQRARVIQERSKSWASSCEEKWRSAHASGDEALARRWWRSLREAQARLAEAEANLAAADRRAWSEHAS